MTLQNVMSLQEMHDRLIAVSPEGVTCPPDCPFCSGEYIEEESHIGGNHVSDKTHSIEEVEALVTAAVAKATAPLQAELDQFKAGEETAEVEAQIAAVRAETETQISEITRKLDEAVLEATQAKQERDEITAWLTAEEERVTHEAEITAKRAARIEQVAAIVTFPDEYVTERSDKWAALSDEDFESLLADYKTIGEKANSGQGPLPKVTAMVATRETGVQSKVGSAVKDLIRGRNLGIDPRNIR